MKRRFRLRRRGDFQATLGAGRIYAGRTLIAFARPRPSPPTRVGVTVSRGVRGAVRRNRARRRVREAARLRLVGDDSRLAQPGIPYDVVLIARPAALTAEFASLLQDAERVAGRLAAPGPRS
ncbi:MAG TPA: ribonuclease P protein component [Candidatus Dormibacteraeota bacterium]